MTGQKIVIGKTHYYLLNGSVTLANMLDPDRRWCYYTALDGALTLVVMAFHEITPSCISHRFSQYKLMNAT